jgi:hypothetical protein
MMDEQQGSGDSHDTRSLYHGSTAALHESSSSCSIPDLETLADQIDCLDNIQSAARSHGPNDIHPEYYASLSEAGKRRQRKIRQKKLGKAAKDPAKEAVCSPDLHNLVTREHLDLVLRGPLPQRETQVGSLYATEGEQGHVPPHDPPNPIIESSTSLQLDHHDDTNSTTNGSAGHYNTSSGNPTNLHSLEPRLPPPEYYDALSKPGKRRYRKARMIPVASSSGVAVEERHRMYAARFVSFCAGVKDERGAVGE